MFLNLALSRAAGTSLQLQIVEQLRAQIIAGAFPAGTQIPPSRELASRYGVSRNTVLHAYAQLTSEGYLTAVKRDRTEVAAALPETCLSVQQKFPSASESRPCVARTPILFSSDAPELPNYLSGSTVDFWPGRPNKALFPLAAWRKLSDEVLSAAGDHLTDYCDPCGLPSLRQAIADHVAVSRGVICSADSVIITAGIQEALNLVSRLFVKRGTRVVLEDPCYQSAMYTFESYGAQLHMVPVDRDGISTELLPNASVSLAYVTPSHQFPTGAAMSETRRIELLQWAHRVGAYIIEDDYDSDYNFDGPPFLSLAGADSGQSVIYVGTFSKSLGAGLRTGYMIVPPHLISAASKVKALTNYGHPWLEQAILARFIGSGAYRRHLRKIRKSYGDTLQYLTSRLEMTFDSPDLWGGHAGMHIMWQLPPDQSAEKFKKRLDAHGGVRVYTLKSGGAFSRANVYADRALLLGYAALSEKDINRAIAVMASVMS